MTGVLLFEHRLDDVSFMDKRHRQSVVEHECCRVRTISSMKPDDYTKGKWYINGQEVAIWV